MKITQVEVTKKSKEGSRIRGFARVTIDDCFLINDIRIIEGDEKLFIAMPSRKTPDGEYRDVAHPINVEMRQSLHDEVLAAYQTAIEQDEDSVCDVETNEE